MERKTVTKDQRPPARNNHVHRNAVPSHDSRLLNLQRSIGNHAIQRLIHSAHIQAKLQISTPGDPLEQEADRTAETVMRMAEPAVSRDEAAHLTPLVQRESERPKDEEETMVSPKSHGVPLAVREDDDKEEKVQRACDGCEEEQSVQRACNDCEEETVNRKETDDEEEEVISRSAVTPHAPAPASANIRAMQGGGSPLPPATRAFFEPRFGADFSHVRIHTDQRAAETAKSLNARAFTVGRDIAFGAGQNSFESNDGRRLLAHELTHVVQQNGSQVQPTIQRAPLCPSQRDSDEVTKSQLPAGVLAVDTSFDAAKESLSVQDFGIGQHNVLPTMTGSDDWRRMMSMILGDPTVQVAVLGYSDCIGNEQNNRGLRDRRANAVVSAMPAEAQAKVSPILKGWWGNLTYLFSNDTAQNRARNRMVLVALMRAPTDSCDRLTKASNIDQYIFLVSCLEKRLGLTKAADAPKTLSLLRQLYFGNATWSTQRNRSKIWDDIITDRPWAPGTDPTPKLGAKLLGALQASKEVKFDSSASSTSLEISHMLTGLDAMMNPQKPAIQVGPISLQTNVFNHALATWAGDVASAATNYTICVDFLKFSTSYDDFFKDLASDADLEGDIDAYAAWAAQNSAPNAPVPLQLNLPLSELLMQYYRLKNTTGGKAREQRFEVFANFYGANVQGKKMQNRLAFQQNIYPAVSEIALLSFAKQMREVLQGNAASIGNCAGGKPPPQTGQPAPVDLGTLLGSVAIASAEMIERFTVWLEKRL